MDVRASLLALALVCCCASAQENKRIDGYVWRDTMDHNMRMGVVVGFIQGYDSASTLAPLVICMASKTEPACFEKGAKEVESYMVRQYRASYGQFLDGLDVFYGDYRNRHIEIRYAFNYVGKSITGTPSAELQSLLETMRKAPP